MKPNIMNKGGMKHFCLYIFLILVTVFSVFSADEEEVFAPFVSRLKVVPEASRVKLTWNDSTDVQGRYIIYRYTEEITETNFHLAEKAGWVPSGKGFFIDTPPEFGTPYYYAVLAESEDGELYELFIPFRNKTFYAVSVEKPVSTADVAAGVLSIEAESMEDFILITYEADKKERELSLYRSVSPIRTAEDILDAELIALVSSSDNEYRDFSIPGIPYYYGIIDSELAKTAQFSFTPGKNATVEETIIPISREIDISPISGSRPRPLPYLTIDSALTTGKGLAVSPLPMRTDATLSPEIEELVSRLVGKRISEPTLPSEPVMLEQDRIRLAEGESYSLGRILGSTFAEQNWDAAVQRLMSFQRTRHTGDDDLRSHFYLGQALFFQQEYRRALYEFLMTRERYRQQTEPWIDAVLSALR